jgi:hypothetical protein
MLLPYGAMIKNDVIEAFNAAVVNPDNIHQGGGINWNFVDSDLQIGLGVIYNSDYLNDCFAVLVDKHFA